MFLNPISMCQHYLFCLDDIDWFDEIRLIVTAILLGGVILGAVNLIFRNFPAWTGPVDWTAHLPNAMQSLFTRSSVSPLQEGQGQAQEGPRRIHICGRSPHFQDPTYRTVLTDEAVYLYGWPSRGGVIILENASAIDFNFLGLDPLNPPLCRSSSQADEDEFCKQLLLLGARWWDSRKRYLFVLDVSDLDSRAISDLDEEREPYPTRRERRWVKVGWPSKPQGGLWVAEYDRMMYYDIDEDVLVPLDAARVTLALNMDERCEILKRMGARFFASVDEYEGAAFLKAWEEKTEGEVGPLRNYQHDCVREFFQR